MDERFCRVGDIELCYETFGDPADPALLLVMGLGTQMVAWHEDFCSLLVERGFHVIRYDNRDIGRSTHLSHLPAPTPWEALSRRRSRKRSIASYSLADMANDAAGLLDCLGIARAHVVGASMGGMIAQLLAARRPDRVLSLTSIMSTTGSRWRGQPAMRIYPWFLRRPPRTREDAIERTVGLFRVIGSPGFERDEAALREMVALSYDRGGGDTAGAARQLAAITAGGNRTADLRPEAHQGDGPRPPARGVAADRRRHRRQRGGDCRAGAQLGARASGGGAGTGKRRELSGRPPARAAPFAGGAARVYARSTTRPTRSGSGSARSDRGRYLARASS
jgi:pimeloyl-ACP methyl ester carboxylesterase